MSLHAFHPRPLPEGLEGLPELALDLRWTWNHAGDHLWRTVEPDTWEATRNPWLVLQTVAYARLERLAQDPLFRDELASLLAERQRYLAAPAWATRDTPVLARPVAYFSMEFGLSEALPLYAGGLGVLAGDHLKAASDLGVPMVAVGLLYQEGYFRQRLDAHGEQEELYPYNDPTDLPLQPVQTDEGGWLSIDLDLPGRRVRLRVWRATVGRVTLYLLDSNAPTNAAFDRGLTGKLYGGGAETRLRQEIVLGIGGWKLLEALRLPVGALHLNEGHAAFAALERARSHRAQHGVPFREALWATRGATIFTTHTPVTAGFDAFDPALMARFFPEGRGLLGDLGISFAELMALGRTRADDASEPFRPAFLALRAAGHVNAVSKLHGETSRALFSPLFPRWPEREVPVTHVTNGVHTPSWDSPWSDELWTQSCGKDRWLGTLHDLEARAAETTDEALWAARGQGRHDLVRDARARLARQLAQHGRAPEEVDRAHRALDPDVLTLGFARRFATYKRPNLLLSSPERLKRLLTNPARPVQLVVAGKAHPEDEPGQRLFEAWIRFLADPAVRDHAIFIEDYDLAVAQKMVQGVDVWINTPRRPFEACGTSGMKVLVNGGLNVSVLDGWWAEAYAPELGWAVGNDANEANPDAADAADAESLFRVLEDEVVPLFYERDDRGLPRGWLARVRASFSKLAPRFSTNRMLREYVERLYRPAEAALAARTTDGGALAHGLARWEARLRDDWDILRWGDRENRRQGDVWVIEVDVYLDDLAPQEVAVELFADGRGASTPEVVRMSDLGALPGSVHGRRFRAEVPATRPAEHYTPRFVPAHPAANLPLELPLITWQG